MKKLILFKKIALNIIFYASLVFIVFVYITYFYIEDLNFVNTSFVEIPQKDSLMLINIAGFDTIKEDKTASKNEKTYNYRPILSILQIKDPKLNHSARYYDLKMSEINIVPELIETRIYRLKVSLQNHYDTYENALTSFKFKDIIQQGQKFRFQFSLLPNEGYEDFGDENTLNINMPTGKHDLYIRAIDLDSRKFTKAKKISINGEEKLNNKTWFWPLFSIAIIVPLFILFYRLKLNKNDSKLQELLALEKQRTKITADLHDDIGATLSSLQINSAIANNLWQKDALEAQKILHKIELQSQTIADILGDVIWSLKPGKEQLMTMSTRIRNFSNEILGSTDINYSLHIDERIDESITEISTRKNIILIIKEALNNVAKYSKATQLNLKIELINKDLIIEIIDNGTGFKVDWSKGNGLGNMKKRTEDLNGKFSIWSEENKGTKILIEINNILNIKS
jgi:signal transduction histidine kinase